MTDERYVFNATVSERSKMKRGAAHKKNGSKSKKCTMPADHLTSKEKKKLNGECATIKMNRPCKDWKQFKKLSESVKYSYITGLVENYGARSCDICEMFGISYWTLHDEFKTWSIPMKPFKKTKNMDERWLDFITKPEVTKSDAEILKERFDISIDEKADESSNEPSVEQVEELVDKAIAEASKEKVDDQEPEISYEGRSVTDLSELELEERTKKSAKLAALYLHTFYDECTQLGFTEVLAQQLLMEQSKKYF